MYHQAFDKFNVSLCIYVVLSLAKHTYQKDASDTLESTQNFRVDQDPNDSKRLLCFCKNGSGVSSDTNTTLR